MAGLAFLGAAMGVLLAYWATRSKQGFRRKLLNELEIHSKNGTTADYVRGLVLHKAQWMKSISPIRKPFRKEINLTIETAGLLLSVMGLVSAVSEFEHRFNGMVEGVAVVMLLGMMMAYIPSEWLFSGRIDADWERVLEELTASAERGDLDEYIARAKEEWLSTGAAGEA